ncbi:MAG: hypothetical protein GX593_08845 [Actinomycetales bacterium]|nr:hypothetical protein [Actinomycetales bacterium]
MVKIPELPGGYQPGDVVNGHVLTEGGNWVPVETAPTHSAPTHGAPAQSGPPPITPTPGAPSSATPNPNPYLRPAPQGSSRRRGGCLGGTVVAILVSFGVGVLGIFATRWIDRVENPEPEWGIDLDEDWADIDIELPTVPLPTMPALPSFTLSEEEAALIEATDWEVWHADYTSHFLVTVEAPGLERPRTTVSVRIEAEDVDGEIHEATDFITVLGGETTLSIGLFSEPFDAEVEDLTVEITPLMVSDEINPYTARVTDFELDHAASRPTVRATLTAEKYGEPPTTLRMAAVARDADGEILNLAIAYPSVPGLGDSTTVTFPMWGNEPVPDDATWQFAVMPH